MIRAVDLGPSEYARPNWRCWLCDEAVDPEMSVNDDRGIDSMTSKSKAKGKGTDAVFGTERLAHRVSRLAPSLHVESRIQEGGGQYLVVLTS